MGIVLKIKMSTVGQFPRIQSFMGSLAAQSNPWQDLCEVDAVDLNIARAIMLIIRRLS